MCTFCFRSSPLARTPSPRRRHIHHDIGFSDTVSNVVEIVKGEHRRGRYSIGHQIQSPRGIIALICIVMLYTL